MAEGEVGGGRQTFVNYSGLCGARLPRVFCALLAALVLTPVFQAPQFTASAMLASGAALFIFVSLWLRPAEKGLHLLAACAVMVICFFAGMLIRADAAFLLALAILPLVGGLGWHRISRHHAMPIAALACAAMTAVLAQQSESAYFARSPGWEHYRQEAALLRRVTEWAYLDRTRGDELQAAPAAAAWSENDHRMLTGWLYSDRQLFGVDRMEAFRARAPRLSLAARTGETLQVLQRPESLVWLFAAACFAPWLLTRSRSALLAAALATGWTCIVVIIAGALFKSNLLHITWPLFALIALLNAGLVFASAGATASLPARRRGQQAIVELMFGAIALCAVWEVREMRARSLGYQAVREELANDVAHWSVRRGDTVVVWDDNFPFVAWVAPFRPAPKAGWAFLDTFHGDSPLARSFYAAWGTSDIAWAMCRVPGVWRVDAHKGYARPHAQILETHMRERYGQQVEIKPVFDGRQVTLYSCDVRSVETP